MSGFVAWKLVIPVAAIAVVAVLMARSGNFPDELATPPVKTRPAMLGYLTAQELPDGIALLPPPPPLGSVAMQSDEQARAAALQLRGKSRYALAAADASRDQADTATAFQCAFGTVISAQATPVLFDLLAKIRLDVRAASYPAKSHFNRPRPFVIYNTHTCYPSDEQNVRNDGSYPSARGAVGWAYAKVLSELNPARAAEILQRGRDFGQSRVVCDEEWLSDVDAGHVIADATLGLIQNKPAFRSDFEAAQKETAAGLKSGIKPANCEAEALALASR